jgi:hypothetical protein
MESKAMLGSTFRISNAAGRPPLLRGFRRYLAVTFLTVSEDLLS